MTNYWVIKFVIDFFSSLFSFHWSDELDKAALLTYLPTNVP